MTMGRNGSREERFEALYRKYYARVYWFFRDWRLSDDEAHDLAQDVFARVFESMDQYRGDGEWAYLETIAKRLLFNRNRALQTDKRRGTHVGLDEPNVRSLAAESGPDLAEQQEDERQKRLLNEAIDELPEGMRKCLRLWLQGHSYAAIRMILKISPDAVKSRLRDAKRLLQERLGDEITRPLPEDNDDDQ